MATNQWNTNTSVIERLQEAPYEFEYHQALRILERLYPLKTPLGEGLSIGNESVSLKSRIFLDWPPSDLYRLEMQTPTPGSQAILWVNFFGLAGAPGPLPLPYTERILDQLKNKDLAAFDFLNIFNHRLLSILYRIRKKYWVGLDYKKPDETKLASSLFSLMGLEIEGLRNRFQIPDRALLYYSGLLWQRPRSLKGCEAILKHYFKAHVSISPFKGKWEKREAPQWTHLGLSGRNQILKDSAALGTRVWNPHGYLEIQIRHLKFDRFQTFLKTGDLYKILREIVDFYLSSSQKFRIRLSLKPGETKPTKLGKTSHLGWTSWLTPSPLKRSDDQVVLYP